MSLSGCAVLQWISPALLWISTLQPGPMGIPTFPPAGRKKVAFQRFSRHQTFGEKKKKMKKINRLELRKKTHPTKRI